MTSRGSASDFLGLLVERILLEETAADAVKDIYEAHRPLLEKHGWKVTQVLGSGQNGTAYALADGERVMKITLDESEARASFAIQGKKNERIVNIEKVFRLPEKEGLRKAYVTIQERLYPLPDKRREELDHAIKFIDKLCHKNLDMWTRGWDIFRRTVENQVDRFDEDGSIDRQATAALKVLKNLGVGLMMDEVLRRGIRFYDYHAGNILMRKDGTPVINDLGVSKAIKSLEPPTLEKKIVESGGSSEERVKKLLAELVPLAVRYAVHVCRTMKACGKISDLVGSVARNEGVDCLVASAPGHFYNVFPLEDGSAILVDVTKMQFSMKFGSPRDTDDPDERDEIQGQLDNASRDPFSVVDVKKIGPEAMTKIRSRPPAEDSMDISRLKKIVHQSMNEAPAAAWGTRDTGAAQLGTAQLGGKPERISKVASLSDLADRFGGLLRKNGLEPVKVLGEGSMGVAYELRDGRVLKITTDPTEARAAYYVLKLKGVKGVARIDQVFRFPDKEIYGIVQEKLQPLPENVGKLFMWAFKQLVVKLFAKRGAGNTDRGWKFMVGRVQKELVDASPEEKKAAAKALEVYQKLGLDKIMDALVAKGIRFHDLHPGNLMMRKPGEYVVIDLGVSDVAGGGAGPPTLEAVVESIVGRIFSESVGATAVESLKPILQKYGIRLGEQLGEGSNGIAYELEGHPNVVVKVTDDLQEVKSSFRVQKYGKKLRHVVRVYDVRKIPGEVINAQAKSSMGMWDTDAYIIIQERLQPLSEEAENVIVAIGRLTGHDRHMIPPERAAAMKMFAEKFGQDHVEPIMHMLDSVQYFETMDELRSIGIRFKDYYSGNVMMRGRDFVVLDLGVSMVQGGGSLPPEIGPGIHTESLTEGPADTVAVIAATLSPFTAAQADFVRRVAGSVNKVVLLPRGGTVDDKTFHELIRASLRDIERKVEVYPFPSQEDVLGALEGLVDKSPALRPGGSFELYVAADDVDEVKSGIDSSGVFGEAPVVVRPIDPKIARYDQQARKQLLADPAAAKRLMDPHLFSDPEQAEELLTQFSKEGRAVEFVSRMTALIAEDLSSVGGEDAIRGILGANATSLKSKKNVDVEKLKLLGSGQKGTAFLVRPGLVLKVTTDEKEARSSMLVKGKSLGHVARVYDVFKFGKTGQIHDDIYGILLEELEPLEENVAAEINRALMLFRDAQDGPMGHQISEALANGRFDELYNLLRQQWTQEMSAEAGSPAAKRRMSTVIEGRIKELQEVLDKYKILDMVKELSSTGVEYADYKAENMGKRDDGTVVVFDLGASRSQGGQPPVFESGRLGGTPGDVQRRSHGAGGSSRMARLPDEWSFEDEGPGRLSRNP